MLVMGVGVVSQAMGALRQSVHGFPHANLGRRSAFLSLVSFSLSASAAAAVITVCSDGDSVSDGWFSRDREDNSQSRFAGKASQHFIFGGGGDRTKHSVAECRSLQDQNSAVCIAARATGALERGLRKQASCADSDTSGSTAQLWWEVNEREEET